MVVLLSLLAALGYGGSDYMAGLAGRRGGAATAAILAQPFGLLAALLGLWLIPWAPPHPATLLWGAASGLGSGLGTLALYRGLARGRMAVVAPLSALITALLPALVGLGLGERPGLLALGGIVLALPAVTLISRTGGAQPGRSGGVLEGLLAGVCFSLLFIGLDRAGTHAGTWPLVPGQAVSVLIIAAAALRSRAGRANFRGVAPLAVPAGVISGAANILFLSATGHGALAVAAVVTSLYPAATVVLARIFLEERWSRLQGLGLVLAALAVALISG